ARLQALAGIRLDTQGIRWGSRRRISFTLRVSGQLSLQIIGVSQFGPAACVLPCESCAPTVLPQGLRRCRHRQAKPAEGMRLRVDVAKDEAHGQGCSTSLAQRSIALEGDPVTPSDLGIDVPGAGSRAVEGFPKRERLQIGPGIPQCYGVGLLVEALR